MLHAVVILLCISYSAPAREVRKHRKSKEICIMFVIVHACCFIATMLISINELHSNMKSDATLKQLFYVQE